MGNSLACFVPKEATTTTSTRMVSPSDIKSWPSIKRNCSRKNNNKEEDDPDDLLLKQQAIAAAMLFQEHQRNNANAGAGDSPFMNRSTSVVYPAPPPKKQSFPRSASTSRQRFLSPETFMHQLVPTSTLQVYISLYVYFYLA